MSGDVHHGIHFQASQWGGTTDGRFTINLTVTSPSIYEWWTGQPFPRNPATALFPVQQRIGWLLPEARDHWWVVSPSTDLAALASSVATRLQTSVPAFFGVFPDSEALLRRLRDGDGVPGLTRPQAQLLHAFLESRVGNDSEALAILRRLLRETSSEGFRRTIALMSERMGLVER